MVLKRAGRNGVSAVLFVIGLGLAGAVSAAPRADLEGQPARNPPDRQRLDALVQQLGSGDYWLREAAAAELRSMGPAAIDALLAAAENSGDLEIALAARWLVDGIPLASPSDTPEVAALLGQLGRDGLSGSLPVMQRLLRVDDDAGIEALARIVRLDRSTAASMTAAALIVQEWQPRDPAFASIGAKAMRGLGTSTRPTVSFLRGVIDFASGNAGGLDEAAASLEQLRRQAERDRDDAEGPRRGGTPRRAAGEITEAVLEDPTIGLPMHPRSVFERTFIAILVEAGRHEQAVAETKRLLQSAIEEPDDLLRSYRIASLLAWSAEHGVPEVVDAALSEHADAISPRPIAMYAAAMASRAAGEPARAEKLADEARRESADTPKLHLDAASKLARWGCTDWALREYETLTTDPAVPDAEFVTASIMLSEFLHDLGRDAEAAACLRRLLEEPGKNRGTTDELLRQVGREPRSTKSRMFFFEACAAESRGDRAAYAEQIDRSIESHAKDVDALIAAYHFPENTPERREQVERAIREAIDQIEQEIEADPDDANALNEYAWLVANTKGDTDRAIRYSKKSLALSFDNASYLDTLAHAQAAAGFVDRAVRMQSVAARLEPHNRTIRRNLERFRGMAKRTTEGP